MQLEATADGDGWRLVSGDAVGGGDKREKAREKEKARETETESETETETESETDRDRERESDRATQRERQRQRQRERRMGGRPRRRWRVPAKKQHVGWQSAARLWRKLQPVHAHVSMPAGTLWENVAPGSSSMSMIWTGCTVRKRPVSLPRVPASRRTSVPSPWVGASASGGSVPYLGSSILCFAGTLTQI